MKRVWSVSEPLMLLQEFYANLEAAHIGLVWLRQHRSDKLAHENIKIIYFSFSPSLSVVSFRLKLAGFVIHSCFCFFGSSFLFLCSTFKRRAIAAVARSPIETILVVHFSSFVFFFFVVFFVLQFYYYYLHRFVSLILFVLLSTAKWVLFNSLTVSVDILLSIGLAASYTQRRIFISWHWYPLAHTAYI